MAALVLLGLCGPEAVAQSANGTNQPVASPEAIWAEREFGEVRSWLNTGDGDLVPVGERPLVEFGRRSRVFIPPRTKRVGFVPRLTTGIDAHSNIFLSTEDRERDAALFVSPGLSFVETGSDWFLWADYSIESAVFLRNDTLNEALDAQTALLFGSFNVSQRTQIEFVDIFQDSQNPAVLPIPGAVPAGERSLTNELSVGVHYQFSSVTDVEARYGNRMEVVDAQGSNDVMVQDVEGLVARRFTRQDQAELVGRFSHYGFDPGTDQQSFAGFLGYTHEFSETLIAEARVGGTYTDADDGRSFVVGSADLHASIKNAVFSFSYDRDLAAAAGIDSMLLADSIGGNATVRVGPGVQAGASVDYQIFETLDDTSTDIDILDAAARVSYAVRNNVWLQLRYNFVHQEFGSQDPINDQRIVLSITGSL